MKTYRNYRSKSLYNAFSAAVMILIPSGLAAAMITAAFKENRLAGHILLWSFFAASIIALIGYFVPYFETKAHVSRLKRMCSVPVKARCTRTGEIPYSQGDTALILPFYRRYEGSDEDGNPHIGEPYYDPEYVYEYEGKSYHVSEHRRTVFGAFQDSERTVYVCPGNSTIFYDERRYAEEMKDNSDNILSGIPSRLIFPCIMLFLLYMYIK